MKKNYKVRITETLVMTVDVEAHSRDEAEQIASDNWHMRRRQSSTRWREYWSMMPTP